MCGVCGGRYSYKIPTRYRICHFGTLWKMLLILYSLGYCIYLITCMHLLGANKVQIILKKKKKGTAPVTFVSFFFV